MRIEYIATVSIQNCLTNQVTNVLTEMVPFGKPGHILFQLSYITIAFIHVECPDLYIFNLVISNLIGSHKVIKESCFSICLYTYFKCKYIVCLNM